MRRVLRSGFQKIEILRWHESHPADAVMEFRDTFFALNFLRRFMTDPLSMMVLRNALAEELFYTGISKLTDHDILQQIAWQIVRGNVKIVVREDEAPRVSLMGRSAQAAAEVAEMEEVEAPAPAAEEKTSWVEIELVDEEGNPVAGEKYRIELPDGSIKEGVLNSQGWARVGNIDPGTCKISFPNFDANEWEPALQG
ncbi:hypothetical protein HYR99_20305 [Candidatus Poribacteria bacterium]|nr:hypothetical protein [Candidatus Poribacteria bacterium]